MTDYTKLVAALRERARREDEYYEHGGDVINDAAAAIEALQAEYECEKRRADTYEELFDIMRKSRNEIIEQIGRVKGVPDFALYYPEYNLCANYPKKTDSSESPNS